MKHYAANTHPFNSTLILHTEIKTTVIRNFKNMNWFKVVFVTKICLKNKLQKRKLRENKRDSEKGMAEDIVHGAFLILIESERVKTASKR
jgi:hypothetical protein